MSPVLSSPFKKSPFNSPVIAKLRCWSARLRTEKCESLMSEEHATEDKYSVEYTPRIGTITASSDSATTTPRYIATPDSGLGLSSNRQCILTPSEAIAIGGLTSSPIIDFSSMTTTLTRLSDSDGNDDLTQSVREPEDCLHLADLDSPSCWANSLGNSCEPSHSLGRSTYRNNIEPATVSPSKLYTNGNSNGNTTAIANEHCLYNCKPNTNENVFFYTPFIKVLFLLSNMWNNLIHYWVKGKINGFVSVHMSMGSLHNWEQDSKLNVFLKICESNNLHL